MTTMLPDWFNNTPLEEPGPGRFYHTTRRYPLFYLQITKCGCTFLKNLIYYLDHGALHPNAKRIHAHEQDFVKADLIPRLVLKASPYLFVVVRNPVDRFLSLYFDKLADTSNDHDARMRQRVSRAAGLDLSPGAGISVHRQNCLKTLAWFQRNLDTKDEGKPNPHWQRQMVRFSHTKGLEAEVLTLDGLSWQLPALLSPLIPEIEDHMQAVRVRNTSEKLFDKAEFLTPEIIDAVHAVYPMDLEVYRAAAQNWAARKP